MASGTWGRLRRWLFSTESVATCPVCDREVRVAGNVTGGMGVPAAIPRPVEEVVAACRTQHETSHTHAEVKAAKDRRRQQTGR